MASETFKFTHASNSVFETRVTLTDGVFGKLNYKIELYNTSPSTWESFNLFSSGINSPLCNINIGSTNFNKNYTYDWKYKTTQSVRRTKDSAILRDLAALQFRVGMARTAGVGIPTGTKINSTNTANSTVTMSANATSSGTSSATFKRDEQPASLVLFSGTLNVTQGSVITLSGSNDCKSTIGNANVSGSFTTAAPEPEPEEPAPTAPSNVEIDEIGVNNLRLDWSASTGTVSRYRVYKDNVAFDTTDSTTTIYNFTGLSSNTSFTLGVRAEGPDNNSSIVSRTATTLPSTFTVPNVVGQAISTAVTNLTNAGFSFVTQNLTTVGATQLNNRTVKSQTPAANTTATDGDDAAIEIYNFVRTVPNIVGRTKAQGEADLAAAGFSNFSSSLRTSGATLANNKLIATQSPASGTLLNVADQITFTINDYRIPVPDIRGLNRQNAIDTLNAAGFTNVTVTTTEVGATGANNLTVFSQNPANSATTFNPADQSVSFVLYDLGIVGKRITATNNSVPLTRSSRLTATGWVQTVVAKKFTASGWVDITLK